MRISSFKTIERIISPYAIYNLYHFKPLRGFSLDSRTIKDKEIFIALKGKHKDGHDFIVQAAKKGAGAIIAARFVKTVPPVPQFIVSDSYSALKKIILFLRRRHQNIKVIAVTGSLGKTTTKEILSFLLSPKRKILKNQGTENNLLGVAKTIFSYKKHDLIIFELGINQKKELADLAQIVKPDIAIITCISPVHLEGLGSIEEITKEKVSLLERNPRAKAVLNAADKNLSRIKLKNRIYWFGTSKKAQLWFRLKKRSSSKVYFKVMGKYDLILPAYLEHFVDNCLAASLAAHILGLSYQKSIERLNSFGGFPPMRMEKKRLKNYLILNDAYNASPGSFQKALSVLKQFNLPKIVVAADMLELGSKTDYYHRELAFQIFQSGCCCCLTFGDHIQKTNNQLRNLKQKNVFHFASHEAIADFIKKKFRNKKCLIFLKGSRKMKLERVLKFL